MKVAVIGSRGVSVEDLEEYLPPATSEIVSGGAAVLTTPPPHTQKKRSFPLRCSIRTMTASGKKRR